MKKLSALLVILAMLVSSFGVFCSFADGDDEFEGGDLTKLIVPKTTYEYDEPILIKAYGTDDSYVGIYFPDDPYSLRYTYIDESMSKGVGSGVEFDMRTAGFPGSNARDPIPAGEYIIKYFPNDRGSAATAWVKIKIVPPADAPLPEKPISATYELDNPTDGLAAGKLTVKVKDTEVIKNVIAYWGDENGELEGYMPFVKFNVTSTETVYECPEWQIIPVGATKLIIYTMDIYDRTSEECFEIDLPEGAYKDTDRPVDFEGGGDLTKLIVPKTTYEYDEPILIRAYGTDDSWVGIYFPDDPYSLRYTYIDESMDKAVGSGAEFDMKTAGFSGSNACESFPLGEYIIKYYPNDRGSAATAWVKIKIVPPADAPLPEKPLSATYELDNPTDGLAAGKLTVKVGDTEVTKNVIPYWGDENGKLEGYMPLARFKVTSTETVYEFPKWQIIPEGATKLILYTSNLYDQLSEDCIEIDLPEGAAYKDMGNPIVELQVVSDTHVVDQAEHTYNTNFLLMLKDIAAISKDSIGLFVVGDMIDSGYESEYKKFVSLYNSVEGVPPYFLAIGNHDLFSGTLEEKTALFLKYATLPDGTHPTSSHYDFWLAGYHFVFLGNDKLVNMVDTTLNKETITWLDETLAEDRDKNRPTFLFLHQGMFNTVAGTLPGENWEGVVSSSEVLLRLVLSKYPEVIMFNGHSHWEFDSDKTMYPRSATLPTIFNTSASSSQISFYNKQDLERVEKSEGYFLKVYEDRVMVLGRNYIDGKWVPSAMYVVDYENGTGPKKNTVSFDVLGIGNGVDDVKVVSGGVLEAPVPEAEGYEFVGWFTDKELTAAYDPQTEVNGDFTLYAKWNKSPEPTPTAEETNKAPETTAEPKPTPDDNDSDNGSKVVIIVIVAVVAVAVAAAVVAVIIKKKRNKK